MNLKRFDEMSRDHWDALIAPLGEATFLHTHWKLEYYQQTCPEVENGSFLLMDQSQALAVVPAMFSRRELLGSTILELSLAGYPMACPAIRKERPSRYRAIADAAYSALLSMCRERGVSRMLMQRNPLSLDSTGTAGGAAGLLTPLAYGFTAKPFHSVVVDLTIGEEELAANMSKYHRRHVNRERKRGMSVQSVSAGSPDIAAATKTYRDLHFKAAGRQTRPDESFEIMNELVEAGKADYFFAMLDGNPVSVLYCGRHRDTAFGWSQANLPEVQQDHSPRQLLEFSAILHYAQQQLRRYYVGVRYHSCQIDSEVTDKMITIADFKDRFGGDLLPYIEFEGFLDLKLAEDLHDERRSLLARRLESCMVTGQDVEAPGEQL